MAISRKRSFRRKEKPPFERFKDHFRKFTAFMFSNVGIILLVIIYTIGGAFMFQAIEITESKRVGQQMQIGERNKTAIAELLWSITCCEANVFNEADFKKRVNETIYNYQKAVIKAELVGMDIEKQWSFSGAFLYSLTVITTIGYGNITPRSNWGKLITILYAIIGMPLFLLYLSNIGDILAKSFKWIYAKLCLCRICPGVARRRIIRERRKMRRMAVDSDLENMEEGQSESGSNQSSDQTSQDTFDNYDNDDLAIEAEIQTNTSAVTVPVTVCIFIMIGYILFGAFLFGKWENWNLLDGSYFCFISLSSIGFGDIVPGEQVITTDKDKVEVSFILCAVYLLLGMALIAMCFNLMQEQVIHQMRSFKRVIKLCFRCKR